MQIWFKALKFYTIVDIFRCSLYSSSNVLPLRALFKTTRLTSNEFKLFFFVYSDFEFVYYIKRLQENMLTPIL